jgi:hypothetical protein
MHVSVVAQHDAVEDGVGDPRMPVLYRRLASQAISDGFFLVRAPVRSAIRGASHETNPIEAGGRPWPRGLAPQAMSHAIKLLAVIFHKPCFDLNFVHSTLKKYQEVELSILIKISLFC